MFPGNEWIKWFNKVFQLFHWYHECCQLSQHSFQDHWQQRYFPRYHQRIIFFSGFLIPNSKDVKIFWKCFRSSEYSFLQNSAWETEVLENMYKGYFEIKRSILSLIPKFSPTKILFHPSRTSSSVISKSNSFFKDSINWAVDISPLSYFSFVRPSIESFVT